MSKHNKMVVARSFQKRMLMSNMFSQASTSQMNSNRISPQQSDQPLVPQFLS